MRGFETILALLLLSTLMALLARKARLPAPIVMVLGGLAAALIPEMPTVELAPELVFTIFVPPLLFRAALSISLRNLQREARSVMMLAVGLVIATTVGIGFIAHFTIQGLSLAAALVLGAILSPPDALVGISLARSLRVPKKLIALVEGETLFNDAAAFVIFREMIRAAQSGTFDLALAGPRFLLVVLGGVAIGYAVYWLVHTTRKYFDDPTLENVIWLFVPFAAFLPAEAIGASGVLAVVVAGVYLRRATPHDVPAETRQQARAVYDVVEFILNSLIFILIGLQLGVIVREAHGPDFTFLIRATAIVTVALIAIRFVCVFLGTYLPRLMSQSIRSREERPLVRNILLLSWMGVRGGDSLVTALAVPLVTLTGAPFPGRNLIVAITFGVILATLLVQGLTLAPLIRILHLPLDTVAPVEEAFAAEAMREAEQRRLAELKIGGIRDPHLLEEVRLVRAHSAHLEKALAAGGPPVAAELRKLELALIRARREAAVKLRDESIIDDELLSQLERELDFEELRLPDPDRVD